jgi:hypothetical protein
MSPLSKAEDPILPVVESTVRNENTSSPQPLEKIVSSSSADQEDEENAAASPDQRTSRQSQLEEASEDKDCFLKVIDVHLNGGAVKVQGKCYSQSEAHRFFEDLPEQNDNTIRVVLNGNSTYSADRIEFSKLNGFRSCTDHVDSFEIRGHHGLYHLPTLRQMLRKGAQPRWYMAATSAWHDSHWWPKHSERGTILGRYDLPYQSSPVRWAVDYRRDSEKKLKLICGVYRARVSGTPTCANASWRWLKSLDTAFTERRTFSKFMESSRPQPLQLLILDILDTTLKINGECFHLACENLRSLTNPHSKRALIDQNVVELLGVSVLVIRDMENAFRYISEAIECVVADLGWSDPRTNASHHREDTTLATLVRDLQQDCTFYRTSAARLREQHIEAQEIHLKWVNAKQADSVNQLTLLAAFFLPLSLAAGVLSMQTRFYDLHLLLYDFVGVVIIVASIAAFLAALNRWGPSIYEIITVSTYGWYGLQWAPWTKQVVKVTPPALWWLALLASFLVGMLKDVLFGLRILGYEAAGITVLWLLSVIGVRIRGPRKPRFSFRGSYVFRAGPTKGEAGK